MGLTLLKIFRYDVTGLTEEHLRNGLPLKEVQKMVLEFLCNGELVFGGRLDGGNAKLLVGHDLVHDLTCLELEYPDHMWR